MYFIFFLFFIFLLIFLFLYFKKEFYTPLIKKEYPFYEYQYLNKYFQLFYDSNVEKFQFHIQKFFSNVSIVFISLQRNKERLRNIHHIIKKYNLKNSHIVNAIDF